MPVAKVTNIRFEYNNLVADVIYEISPVLTADDIDAMNRRWLAITLHRVLSWRAAVWLASHWPSLLLPHHNEVGCQCSSCGRLCQSVIVGWDGYAHCKECHKMSEPIKLYRVRNGEEVIVHAPSEARQMLASGYFSAGPVVAEAPTGPAPTATDTELTEETPTDGSIDPSPATIGGNRRRNRRNPTTTD